LHQVRVCLSLSRLTNDVKIRQRCEELAMDFAARIGGKDDFDIMENPERPATAFEPQ
jgi:glutamate/tyrosine decarboxylase-like PLP-dependent enzyme